MAGSFLTGRLPSSCHVPIAKAKNLGVWGKAPILRSTTGVPFVNIFGVKKSTPPVSPRSSAGAINFHPLMDRINGMKEKSAKLDLSQSQELLIP
jgi:hypothetical protein